MASYPTQWTTISQANSFHPHLITNIDLTDDSFLMSLLPESPEQWSCSLDVIYTLPPSVFVDRYQLNDTLGRSFFVHGLDDLESPLEHVDHQDTWVIVRPSPNIQIDLPVHLRYQAPDRSLTHRLIHIQQPRVGWSCHHGNKKPTLDQTFDFFFSRSQSLTWIQLPSNSSSHDISLQVPVGNTTDAFLVQWGTFFTILLGTAWILHATLFAVKKHRRHEAKGKRRKSE
ncbi:PIG-X [Halteromyces radiatus]|uniref:PIG-X n=1 Tax=Halteromyces radiatus TaxID=101107 RepID=UPI00221E738B|nr:PIG-X [Halteromyces radiatus]KAI8081421.1 PIG-X [Halteromyces radiatus]